MKDELEKKLTEEFPDLYSRPMNGPREEDGYSFPFSCGDGWFPLIYDLSIKLNAIIQTQKAAGMVIEQGLVSQVKEKYGGLRYYMSTSTEDMDELISEAENIAEQTCEKCGAPGKTTNTRWVQTLCDEHLNASRTPR